MKLSKCTYGTLVTDGEQVGMVVGITNNYPSESRTIRAEIENARPLVHWSCGDKYPIHPGNIEIFKG